ncbi:MAG: hypothetical protein M3Q27_09040 [Actinomycetota bacterium]|nr:hypothetical protein [Actinomycetota bacterium]
MEAIAGIVPPLVMAVIFIAVAVTAFRATDRSRGEERGPDRHPAPPQNEEPTDEGPGSRG